MKRSKALWLAGAVIPMLAFAGFGASAASTPLPAGSFVVAQDDGGNPDDPLWRKKHRQQQQQNGENPGKANGGKANNGKDHGGKANGQDKPNRPQKAEPGAGDQPGKAQPPKASQAGGNDRPAKNAGGEAPRPGNNGDAPAGKPGKGGQNGDRPGNDQNGRPGDTVRFDDQGPQGDAPGFRDRHRRTVDDLRRNRQERQIDGADVIFEPGGRTIIRQNNRTIIRYNELDRLEDFGRVRREHRGDNTVTIVERENGVRIITVTDPDGHVIRRVRQTPDGRQYVLFENRPRPRDEFDVDVIVNLPRPTIDIPPSQYVVEAERATPTVIYDTFAAPPVAPVPQRYTLEQVVNSPTVLERVRRVDLDTITFDTGSWQVADSQIGALDSIAKAINQLLDKDPNAVFLIEGHTDAVGSDIDNLSLSDRRAEEVAYLLTQYYKVPPENLTTKGYGETQLKVQTDEAERQNRRVTMRNITPLLQTSDAGATADPAAGDAPQQ